MAGGSIAEPGVEVIQEFVTPAPSIITPVLQTVLVGPVFQLVDAFDDEGAPQSEALAGVYRDGFGVISYNLPGLLDTSVVSGFEDDVRVFLTYGSEVRELNPEAGEEVITSGSASGALTWATLLFTDATALFDDDGVEAGDVVRFDYRGVELDLAVEAVNSNTELLLSTVGPIDEDLASLDYEIVRNPAEFVFAATTQASTILGDDADYLVLTVLGTSDYAGSAGDNLSLLLTDSVHYLDATDGAKGDSIFTSAAPATGFTTSIGPRGPVTGSFFLFTGVVAPSNSLVFRQVLTVVGANEIFIETGEGAGSGPVLTYVLGDEKASGSDGITDGAGTTFTSPDASTDFETALGVGPGPVAAPAGTYIEIEGNGVYDVTTVVDDKNLTLGTAAPINLTTQNYTLIVGTDSGADGETAAADQFGSVAADLSTLTGAEYINVGEAESDSITSVDNIDRITMTETTPLTFGAGLTFSAVDAAAPLQLSFDENNDLITVQLERTAGLTSSSLLDIDLAISDSGNPSYNAEVSAIIAGALSATGALTIDGVDLDISQQFDGGADEGQLTLDADLLGSPVPTAQVYVTYKALRTDVSSSDPTFINLLEFSTEADVDARIGPVDIRNPLALACSRALQNSPSRPVKAIGVDDVSDTKPFGTSEAYTSAFDFLEAVEVYTIVPLTQDPTIHQLLQTHVNVMSEPANKSERIGFFNQELPAYSKASVLASGVDGNNGAGVIVGNAAGEFQASVDFAAAGVQAAIDNGETVLLVVSALSTPEESSDAVNGTVGPLYGIPVAGVKTGDNFTLEVDGTGTVAGGGALDPQWDSLVDVSFTVYSAGIAISQASDQAEAVSNIGEGFADRRMFHHWPDKATTDVDGTEQLVEGFYLASGWAGVVNQVKPEQGLTRLNVSGFTGLRNSNGYFSRANLDRMAGGGTFISVQDAQGTPVRCRHQLSTDVSSIQKRELSITKIVDYTAKFLRLALNKHIGKFNITQTYLDALSTTVQGILANLVESGKLIDARLVELKVNDLQPDTIDVTVAIDVPFPANYIVVTIEI